MLADVPNATRCDGFTCISCTWQHGSMFENCTYKHINNVVTWILSVSRHSCLLHDVQRGIPLGNNQLLHVLLNVWQVLEQFQPLRWLNTFAQRCEVRFEYLVCAVHLCRRQTINQEQNYLKAHLFGCFGRFFVLGGRWADEMKAYEHKLQTWNSMRRWTYCSPTW